MHNLLINSKETTFSYKKKYSIQSFSDEAKILELYLPYANEKILLFKSNEKSYAIGKGFTGRYRIPYHIPEVKALYKELKSDIRYPYKFKVDNTNAEMSPDMKNYGRYLLIAFGAVLSSFSAVPAASSFTPLIFFFHCGNRVL